MKIVYESYFYDFALSDDIGALVFLWKPETTTMTDNDFKEGLSNFAGYGFEYGMTNMVVDVRNFAPSTGAPSAEVMGPWRTQVVIPRYNKVGIRKFAYLPEPRWWRATGQRSGPSRGRRLRNRGVRFGGEDGCLAEQLSLAGHRGALPFGEPAYRSRPVNRDDFKERPVTIRSGHSGRRGSRAFFRSFAVISFGGEVVLAFFWCEGLDTVCDGVAEIVDGSGGGLFEEGLEL